MPRALILHIESGTNVLSCYVKEDLFMIRVQVKRLTGQPTVGKFLSFEYNGSRETSVIQIETGCVEEVKPEDCISKSDDGSVLISSWIGFSDDPNHKTYDRKVAFADWYGLLDCSQFTEQVQGFHAFATYLQIKEDLLTNPSSRSQPFRIVKLRGPLMSPKKTQDVKQMMTRLKNYEKGLMSSAPRTTRNEEAAVSVLQPLLYPSHPEFGQASSRKSSTPVFQQVVLNTMPPSSVEPEPADTVPQRPARRVDGPRAQTTDGNIADVQNRLYDMRLETPNQRSSVEKVPLREPSQRADSSSRPDPLPSRPEESARRPALLRSRNAVAVIREDFRIVIYLLDVKVTAVMWPRNPHFRFVHLGATFECVYQPMKETDDVAFEVMNVIQFIEDRRNVLVQVDERKFAMKFTIDFYSPCYKFGEWYQYEGAPIMNTKEGDKVILATMVTCGDDIVRSCQDTVREYGGSMHSRWLIGRCQLESQRIPRMMVDEGYIGVETVRRYVWKLVVIEGADDVIQIKEQRERYENLGPDRNAYADEDDMARQKRMNRQYYSQD